MVATVLDNQPKDTAFDPQCLLPEGILETPSRPQTWV